MLKLNLGSCDTPRQAGWTNIDKFSYRNVDEIVDLESDWPWADDSVDVIKAHDVIEHLHDKIKTMNEAWRVLKHGGVFDIVVPTTNGPGAWQDPTHVSYWNRNSFLYYTDGVPERERFCAGYGVVARFKVLSAEEEVLFDKVTKLHIRLAAVKSIELRPI